MNFYRYILIIIAVSLRGIKADSNPELFPEAGLVEPSPLSVGLIFYITFNNTSYENDYDVEITPDECCLNEDGGIDCDYLNILGGCSDFIEKGKTKTLRVVAPILDVYERIGYCTVYADSKANNGPNKRDTIKINFDTTIENNRFDYPKNFEHCKYRDEDPFNECRPVNCDTYYNGKKSYFSRKYKRCIEVPPCVLDKDLDYPTVIYNPINNRCYENSLNQREINDLKILNGHISKGRKPKDVLIISKYQPNMTEFVNSVDLIDHVIRITTSKPLKNKFTSPERNMKHNCLRSFWRRYIIDNRWTLFVLSFVITVQCFLICTMIYCLSKTCNCFKDKKLVRKFFNYRHDASVTTPLIGTSNIDTETDYQYLSDTSNNAEQKIKCYKACQKENKDLKTSLSDDILSKYLNRRDWKKFKSEAITEVLKDKDEGEGSNLRNAKFPETEDTQKRGETKVVFEDEIKNIDRNKSKAVSIVSNVEILNDMEHSNIETNISSEREINCHNYCVDGLAGFKPTRYTDFIETNERNRGTPSVSTEKGAQIYFSNDSIDDILSERGVTYLAGENISKYTFSTDFNDIKPSSTVSSKTSKNFVKNVLSLLHKKTKSSTSDPGQKENLDVKLIHMSKASVYTSSNDSNFGRMFKRRDSRTSF